MKRLGLTAVAVALAVTAAGCAPTDDPGDGERGGTINAVARYVVPGGFNVLTSTDNGLPGFIQPAFNQLVKFGTGPDVVGVEVVPDLADSWDISDDGLVYTFHLNPEARFHDIPPVDGRTVTAHDVVATFEAIVREGARTAYQFVDVVSMEAADDHTFVMTLAQPMSMLLENLAMVSNFILPVEGIEGEYDMDTTIIGSGPYIAGDIDTSTIWRWERNPDYFKEGLPLADTWNTIIVQDSAASVAALRSGQVNVTPVGQQADVEALVASGDFEAVNQIFGPEMLYINPAVEPFDDLRVRRAIAMAVDWESMGEAIRGEAGLTSVIPPQFGGVDADELRRIRPYDPEQARQLLAEAGYADGFSTTMVVQQFDGFDVNDAEWIVEDLKEVGIELTLETVDTGTYNARQRSQQFGLMRGFRTLVTTYQWMNDLQSDSPTNFTKTDDSVLDDLIVQYREELDAELRDEIAAEFTRYFETEVATVIASPMTRQWWVWSTQVDNTNTSVDTLAPSVFAYGTFFERTGLTR